MAKIDGANGAYVVITKKIKKIRVEFCNSIEVTTEILEEDFEKFQLSIAETIQISSKSILLIFQNF